MIHLETIETNKRATHSECIANATLREIAPHVRPPLNSKVTLAGQIFH